MFAVEPLPAGHAFYGLENVLLSPHCTDHTPDWLGAFADAVAAMPEVMEVYRMAGEIDYLLRVAVGSMADYDDFYRRLIARVPLKNVTSRFAMERVKHTTAYPLGDDGTRA